MKADYRKICKVVLIATTIFIIGWLFIFTISQTKYGLRYVVFCKDIQTGYSMPEIRSVISKYGEFTETPVSFTSFSAVGVYFNNQLADLLFGSNGITLVFVDGKLDDVRVPSMSMDNYQSLCK